MSLLGSHSEMPFLEHLEELRVRLMWIAGALAIGVGLSFYLLTRFDLLLVVQQPILPYLHGQKLIYTHPADPFRILMSSALVLGTICALPVILWHVWAFLSPALYSHEKKVVIPVLIFGAVLFLAGVSLSFFVILPLTLKMLTGIQSESLTAMISVKEYFSFALGMSLALGAVFELPIAVLALTAIGLVTPAMLNKFRRHAAVLCLVGSAFITPGADPFSLIALAVPLYMLFELSVGVSVVVHRRRLRRQAASDAEQAGAAA